METNFGWKKGCRFSVDANVAGRICEELAREGRLTAQELVNVSRPEDTPLHKCFTWDDSVAAEKYRCQESRCIIGGLEVNVVGDTPPTRAWVNCEVASPNYERLELVLKDDDKRSKLLSLALQEMRTFRTKYQNLCELAEIFEAMDEVFEKAN